MILYFIVEIELDKMITCDRAHVHPAVRGKHSQGGSRDLQRLSQSPLYCMW